jgi:C4-dicarboxylate-specific signal transduction histidine kinase
VGTHLALRRLQVQLNNLDEHVEQRVEARTNELAKTVSELQSQIQQLLADGG